MYYNVFGERVSRRRFKEMCEAANNRRELIAAGLTSRRALLKMGLLGAGGMLVAKSGLSARAQTPSTQTVLGKKVQTDKPPSSGTTNSPGTNENCVPGNQAASPMTRAFILPLPIMPVTSKVTSLTPAPTEAPNFQAGEVRAAPFQAPLIDPVRFPVVPKTLYEIHQESFNTTQFSPDLPLQTVWGFNDGTGPRSPGPTYQAFYGKPQLTRNHNSLPNVMQKNNTGFGIPTVSTHLHNGHTPSESDGNPCDFYPAGYFCDQYYPNVLAGFNSDHTPNGDLNESLSTLWYHDHRVDFTSQNVYKGLAGFYLLFNDHDTGDESTGFHLPSFPQFDIPLMFNDKVFDPTSGHLVFDLFNLDGILGDKFLVNGVIQPYLVVSPRRYRFRLLDAGPSRFYEFFLTGDIDDPSPTTNPFHLIATDGNLIPNPVQVTSVRIGVAERVDIIIDFSKFSGQTLYLENRLLQLNGQGPVAVDSQQFAQNSSTTECTLALNTSLGAAIRPAGKGDRILQFQVTGPTLADNSMDPVAAENTFALSGTQTFYALPSTAGTPRVVRTFKFDRLNGQWSVNGQFMDCNTFRFTVQQNSIEHWILTNLTGDWSHPVHIHLEEHQILNRNRKPPTVATDLGRKDVTQLHPNERVELFFRFRDWVGKYPIHCHNVIHEDHAMMVLWQIQPNGDTVLVP